MVKTLLILIIGAIIGMVCDFEFDIKYRAVYFLIGALSGMFSLIDWKSNDE
jgi:hypothetical protein